MSQPKTIPSPPAAHEPPDGVVLERRVVSREGAAIQVTEIILSDATRAALGLAPLKRAG